MAPSSHGLTPIRRGVGLAMVLFLLGCAVVFYREGPDFTTFGPSSRTAVESATDPGPTWAGSESAVSGGSASTADQSPASGPTPSTIQVEQPADSAKSFQTVRIRGTYRGGAGILLRVQRWEGGIWLDFPVPTKTDQSGQFTAHVEIEKPGRYWLRVRDPNSGVESEPFALVVTV